MGTGHRQPDRRANRALTTLASRIRPDHAALVLVNLQSGLYGDSVWAIDRAAVAASTLLQNARAAGCLVIHARSAPLGEIPAPFVAALTPQDEEQIVTCHRVSAFADTQLDVLLRSNCIRTIIVAGATTNGTVEAIVREAADRDYYVIVPQDCVASLDEEVDLHNASLTNIGRYFGTVVGSNEIAAVWRAMTPARAEHVTMKSVP